MVFTYEFGLEQIATTFIFIAVLIIRMLPYLPVKGKRQATDTLIVSAGAVSIMFYFHWQGIMMTPSFESAAE